MAIPFRKAPRARQTTSTTGSGASINLDAGAALQHQTLVDGLLGAYGDTTAGHQVRTPYILLSGNGTDFELGRGIVTRGTPDTFNRETVNYSTNSNARINLTGVSKIWCYDEAMEGFYRFLNIKGVSGAQIDIDNYTGGADDGSYAAIEVRSANGTEDAPLYPTSGQIIGGWTAWGWDESSSSWKIGGQILAVAEEDWSPTSQSTSIVFAANQAGTPTDEWNATYNTNYTITVGGTVATTNINNSRETIIGTASHASGKYYFEVHVPIGDVFVGLAEASHVNNLNLGDNSPAGGGGTAKSVGLHYFSTVDLGTWHLGGAATASGSAANPGNQWLGFAVDLDAGYIIFRKTSAPTVWYGNNSNAADPASIATNGFSISSLAGQALFLAATSQQNGVPTAYTMNTGATAFQASAPAGYGPWTAGNSFTAGLKIWPDSGLAGSGLDSQGPGTINMSAVYANDVLISDGAGGTALTFASLGDVTISGVATSDFIAWSGSAWTNRTNTAATALLVNFVGDSGSGGTKGLVPAPGAGDAAAGKYLSAGGGYSVPPGVTTFAALTDVAVSGMASNDFLAWNGSAWSNRTVTATTALLNAFVGDSGSGGTKGLVPAPAAGDAAAGKYLSAGGGYSVPPGVTLFSDLSDVTITSVATSDFLAWSGSHWTNRTHAAATALLDAMVGDSGSGGTKGLVPAPGAGDAAAGKFLGAGGTYSVPAGTASTAFAGGNVNITSPAEDDVLYYISSQWTNKRPKYAISAFVSGVLANSQNILYHRFSKAVTIPANFGAYLGHASEAGGSANATASTVINVDKAVTASPNSFSNVGTITIASSSVTPTFASSGGTTITFAQGDVLRIQGPATADVTFAGFYATLVGYET